MKCLKFWAPVSKIAAAVVVTLTLSGAAASQYQILHVFTKQSDVGPYFYGTLALDAAGNLYGTAAGEGQLSTGGAVFKLTASPDGSWTASVLHRFTGTDGLMPIAGVILDGAGNLYGTTAGGGANGDGVVYELVPNPDGSWSESVLHSFDGADGLYPYGGLVFDAAGNLYGTTGRGGTGDFGVVYKLTPNPGGSWTESVLHSFAGSPDGLDPWDSLIFDTAGNLYGTTAFGGVASGPLVDGGAVFQLKPNSDGSWTENILHRFAGTDGYICFSGLVLDAAGNLYGLTQMGGQDDAGAVFKLKPNADGTWTESVLYSFTGGADGGGPGTESLIFDAAGNLYGTATGGGAYDGGVVFKLRPHPDGTWTENVLHSFKGEPGKDPTGGLTMDAAGHLYGDVLWGTNVNGLVYEITP
jgi:uncharacterized repeat protein (TIGR03803 family)